MKEGWNAVTGNRGVLNIVILISIATFYLGFLQTLISPMILSFSNSKVLGIIESISAAGMLLGSIIIGISRLKSYVTTLAAGFCFAGVFIAFLGISTNLILITISGILFFTALPFINTSAEVMVRCKIPNELQGRAWGLISILSQLGYILAYALSGVLADRIFNPMFLTNGLLAGTVGKLIGTGPGRGIGFMLILSGVFIISLGLVIREMKTIKAMEPISEAEVAKRLIVD
jgi:MFS family permease